jgi:hypothetical protein
MRLRSVLALTLVGIAVAVAGCSSSGGSSSGGSSSGGSSTTEAPEDVLVPNAQVTAGLVTLTELVARARTEALTGSAGLEATVDDAWSQWVEIEGRVKKNDTGAYLEFEDALSDMRVGAKAGDSAKVTRGADAVAALITAYVAKFPS